MFDSVTLLGEGQTVYHGPAVEAKDYFLSLGCVCGEHENPPDVFLDFIQNRGRQIEQAPPSDISLAEKFGNSRFARVIEEELEKSGTLWSNQAQRSRSATYPSGFFRQLLVISKRTLLNFKRLGIALRAQVVLNLFLSLLIGLVFLQLSDNYDTAIQNRTGALFLIIMTTVFTNMPAVEMFVKQRALFMHESASGYYRVSSYFLARVLCDMLPLRIIPVLFFSLVSYWMIGLTCSAAHFGFFVLDILLTSLSTASLAFLYSSIASEVVLALLMLASTMVIMLIFGGLFVNLSSPPAFLRWIKWVSIIRYSMEALCINELENKQYCFGKINGTCPLKNETAYGNTYLSKQGFNSNDKWKTQIILFAMFFGVLVLTYIRLRFVSKVK
jgi:ATP-binding cassette subfamily G (WHITE) protein 2